MAINPLEQLMEEDAARKKAKDEGDLIPEERILEMQQARINAKNRDSQNSSSNSFGNSLSEDGRRHLVPKKRKSSRKSAIYAAAAMVSGPIPVYHLRT